MRELRDELIRSVVPQNILRVVIADDRPVFCAGLVSVLNAGGGIEVVARSTEGRGAIRDTLQHQPDVLLVNLQLREPNGVEVIGEVSRRAPEVKVLVFSALADDDSLLTAVRAGARGYLLQESSGHQIVRAVKGIAAGESIFSSNLAFRVTTLLKRSTGFPAVPLPELTRREREVLTLLAEGLSNAAIARELRLAQKTVSNHVSNIYTKLGLGDRGEATLRARDAGLGRAVS